MTQDAGTKTAWGVAQSMAWRKGFAPARTDSRPLFYGLVEGSEVSCFCCDIIGIHMNYRKGEAFLTDPSNPPPGGEVGSVYTVCKGHLPSNAVIYDPVHNICHDKEGKQV